MSDDNQNKNDDFDAIFDESNTVDVSSSGDRSAPIEAEEVDLDYSDMSVSKGDKSLEEDDIEEGIFAPERTRRPVKKSSSLLLTVSVLAIAGVGGFVYFSSPDMVNKIKENLALEGEEVFIPPVDIAAENTQPVIPADESPTPVTMPEVSTEPSVVAPSVEAQLQAQPVEAIAENPAVAVNAAPVSDLTAVAPETPLNPSSQIPLTATPTTETPPVAIPATAPVDTAATLVPDQNTVPQLNPSSADATSVQVPTVPTDTPEPAKASVPVETAVTAPQSQIAPNNTPNNRTSEAKVHVVPKGEEDKPVVVESAEERQRIADQKLDQYFDSPNGKFLKDMPAPSMDPKKGTNESIIIVNKKKSEKPSFSGKSSPVTIQATNLDSKLVSANRAVKLQRYDAAKELYDDLYRQNPRDEKILMGRAVLLQKMGQLDEAASAYEEILSQFPDNKEAAVNLGGLMRKSYPAAALSRLLDLQQKYPDNAVILAQLGVAYADSGNLADAQNCLMRAAQKDGKSPQHQFNLAVIYEKMKNPQAAIASYEKALELDATNESGVSQIPREKIYDRLAILRGQ